jgi:hypothetical protein
VTFLIVLAVLAWTFGIVLAVLGRLLRAPDRDARVIVRPLPWPRIEIDVGAADRAAAGRPAADPGTNGGHADRAGAHAAHNGPDREISTA